MSLFSQDIDWKEFKNPPKSSRPMVRWWWPGCDVDKEELIKEVQELDEAGFLGAEIQVFMIGSPWKLEKKDKARAARTHRFMKPYYYEMIKAVLDEASSRDMIMDLTIGSAWPAGGVHISKDDSMKVLLVGQKIINGPKYFKGKIPKIKKPFFYKLLRLAKLILGYNLAEYFKDDMELEALIAFKPIKKLAKIKYIRPKTVYINRDSIIDLTEKVIDDGTLNWEVPEGKWQVFAFYKGPSGSRPLLDCKSSPNELALVLDHHSSKSISNHLDLHLGESKKYFGEYFGNTLRAVFTDSLELSSEWLWTDDFLEQFKKRRRYDLRPYLPVCFVPNRDNKYAQAFLGGDTPIVDFKEGLGERIRYDLELTLSDLFSEEFVHTITDWMNKNNLKNRIQTYGIRADTLKSYGMAHIPETEQLYAGGIRDFLQFAGSAGIIYEKPIVSAESLVWNQRDYMTTPLKMKVAADRLFVSGINQMIYHGFPYQSSLFPYPGYCGFSTPFLPKQMNFSSNFSRMNPFWEFLPIINQYITRCQYVLQHGKTVTNVAIYYPLFNYNDSVLKKEELVGGHLDENDAPLAKKQMDAHVKKNKKLDHNDKWLLGLIGLTDKLISNGYYYTHINEESILKSKVINNKLIIGIGEFNVLILPSIESISLDLTKKLKIICDSGIPIIFLKLMPDKQPGYLNYEKNDKIIKDLNSRLIESEKAYLIKTNQELLEYIEIDLKIKPCISFFHEQPNIHFIHKRTENSDYYFIRSSKNRPLNVSIKFTNYENEIPFFMDSWKGDIYQAIKYKKEDNQITIDLLLEAYGSIFILFKKSEENSYIMEGPERIKRIGDEIIGFKDAQALKRINLKRWDFKTEIRHFSEKLILIELKIEGLKDWQEIKELRHCSSIGFYNTTFKLEKGYIQEDLQIILSLGRVHDVAVVRINGKKLDPLLVYPFEIDITPHIELGENQLEIEIIPTLRNRLIGYGKKGGKDWKNHKKKKEFMPSGLIGPVTIIPLRIIDLNK